MAYREQFFSAINADQHNNLKTTFQAGRTYLIEYYETNIAAAAFPKVKTVFKVKPFGEANARPFILVTKNWVK